MKGSPFKFLDSFSKEDKDIFFGRTKETNEIYSRVFQSNLLLVYGASGTGKTSLIQCGLANKFNDADWLPVIIRRGSNMIASVRTQLEYLAVTPFKPSYSLKKSIQSLYLDHFKPVYLIFDQFEELFIFGSSEEIQAFVEEASKILHSDLQCKFIFVIRGEYLEQLTVFEELIPEFLNNRIRIEKMTRLNACEAIEGPCHTAGIQVEEGFAQRLLDILSPDKAEVELTYLQVFLDKLYKKAVTLHPGKPVFTISLLQQIGKISDILSDFLEEQISRIPDQEAALTILKGFVSMEGTKRQVDCDEIVTFSKTLGKDIGKVQAEQQIRQFVDLRILRDKDESGKFELRHDALAVKIYEKITIVEKELIEVRLLIESAYTNYNKRQVLLTETDLAYIGPYERRLFLNEKLMQFIEESKRAFNQSKRRRMLALVIIAGLLFTVLSGFTIWALTERSAALEQNREAGRQKQLAEQEKNLALRSKDEALKANHLALEEKQLAEHHEKSAMAAMSQAEKARQEALSAMTIAEREKSIALEQTGLAKKEASNAELQKEIAKKEKLKAEASEKTATRSYVLSTAQSVALKVPLYKNDPQLQGLLACQAYQINQANGGNPRDPFIYDALRIASAGLGNEAKHVFQEWREVSALFEHGDTLSYASHDMFISRKSLQTMKTENSYLLNSYKQSQADLYFFNSNGKQVLSSRENFKLVLWDLPITKGTAPSYQELSGHRGLIRSVAYDPSNSTLASGGKDSLILIWNMQNPQQVKFVKMLRTEAAIKSLVFGTNENELISLQEDGRIFIWDILSGTKKVLTNTGSSKASAIALNRNTKVLVIGMNDGSLCFENLETHTCSFYKAHTSRVSLIAFNKDYSLLATSGAERVIKIFNTLEPEESPEIIGDLNSRARALIFTDDNRLVISTADRKVYILEPSSSRLAAAITKLLKRNLSRDEWNSFFKGLPYQKTLPGLSD
jgi:WD40 repeat protein